MLSEGSQCVCCEGVIPIETQRTQAIALMGNNSCNRINLIGLGLVLLWWVGVFFVVIGFFSVVLWWCYFF